MHRHPEWGAEILASMPGLEPVATIVRYHHEHWDGAGYPDGLAGERIPLASRVISVCDAYDAMTSDRPYRPALTEREAIDQLRAGAGSQFDPRVVDRLVAVLDGRDGSPEPVRQQEAPVGVRLSWALFGRLS
jgi:HD-GYP domain-containing protein (c-di-GMP phosphodiesterase class II)